MNKNEKKDITKKESFYWLGLILATSTAVLAGFYFENWIYSALSGVNFCFIVGILKARNPEIKFKWLGG